MIQLLSEKELWLSASRFIAAHGDQAALQAVEQSYALFAAGDMQGAALWRTMIDAIEMMQATEPSGAVH